MATETPMMKQYNHIKSSNSDSILFFRLGDFYEMFHDDAITVSSELSLTLTGRGKDENRVPMCGVPFHAAEGYISKLVQKGYKVAICEQMESVNDSNGPAHREVVRIVTPGTVQLNSVLIESESNYLAAITNVNALFGIAYIDISTAEFKCEVFKSFNDALHELQRIQPKELLVSEEIKDELPFKHRVPFIPYQVNQASNYLKKYFNITDLSVFDIQNLKAAFPAIVATLEYVAFTQKGVVAQIRSCKPANVRDYCRLDQGVLNHLDLFSKKGLFDFINYSKTAMGSRELKRWLRYPLKNMESILDRQNKIRYFQDNQNHFDMIRASLSSMNDIERTLSKICSRYDNPRDILALRDALNKIPIIIEQLGAFGDLFFSQYQTLISIYSSSSALYNLVGQLNMALNEDVPNHIRDGGIFKDGYSKELDELCHSFYDIRQWIKELEPKCREQYDIKNLKVGFNKVFGYYIEIPNSQKHKVPDHFIRKQTLTNAERYITPVLKEKESILLNAKDQQSELEKQLYGLLIEQVKTVVPDIQTFSSIIASLDSIQSLTEVANRHRMVCPDINTSSNQSIIIEDLWHPMVSENQSGVFIKNNINMCNDTRFFLITGPNMAGKSTVMRSIAIAVILAQMGAMVPAKKATFSLVDQIFTRIGANDNLSEGQSTFMVEMIETATICNNATKDSLILLDEVGRGTSTFDGVSIAAAVSEYLITTIKARTLFATHYHELTSLSEKYKEIKNVSMEISECNKELVFSYKLIPGTTKKSYGVQVAKMAGLPNEVTIKAQHWLEKFEDDFSSSKHVQLSLL